MKKSIRYVILTLLLIVLNINFVYASGAGIEMARVPGGLADDRVNVDNGGIGGGGSSAGENVEILDPGMDESLVILGIKYKVKDVWATIVVLVQIGAIACIVFAGLRYMFAAADQKADIKQGLIFLTLGAVLVFGATLIIQLVVGAAEQIM